MVFRRELSHRLPQSRNSSRRPENSVDSEGRLPNTMPFVGCVEHVSYGTGFLPGGRSLPMANRIVVTIVTLKVTIAVTHLTDWPAAAHALVTIHPWHKLCS